jgi:hypothetical protein
VSDTKKHTRGPWKQGGYFIWRGDDRRIPIHAPKRGRIAEVYREQDAPVIAAAPELLEALERCMGALRVVSPGGDADPDVECARAAIAKATGATS